MGDWLTHFKTTPPLIALHHAFSAFASFAAASSSGWLGLSVSTAQALELGSIGIELAEFEVVPLRHSYLFCVLSSVVPWLWVFPAVATKPPDAWAFFVVAG